MAKEKLPFVYVANQFSDKRIENMEKIKKYTGVDKDTRGLIRQLQYSSPRAFYTADPELKHQSLRGINYGRVTSPLIMFGDYLASEAVHLFIINKNTDSRVIEGKKAEYSARCHYMNERIKAIGYFKEHYRFTKKDN
jgi:hypothetical protein